MFKIRFWRVVFFALLAPRSFAKSHLRFWVTPFDCDINLHCNNASYLKYMDLGRWDYILRMKVFRQLLQAKLTPMAVRVEIDFKKALPPGAFITLDTEIESIGERSFNLRQSFHSGQRVVAEAIVKVVFVHGGKAA